MSYDPRPVVTTTPDGVRVCGYRCAECGHVMLGAGHRCPLCGAAVEAAVFGPEGEVFAATRVHVVVRDRAVPRVMAHCLLDHGPRLLAQIDGDVVPEVGDRVRLVGVDSHGDVRVELVGSGR